MMKYCHHISGSIATLLVIQPAIETFSQQLLLLWNSSRQVYVPQIPS